MSGVRNGVPRPEPATPLGREVFEEAVVGDHGLIPEAYLVAEDAGGAWVGQTTLFRHGTSPDFLQV